MWPVHLQAVLSRGHVPRERRVHQHRSPRLRRKSSIVRRDPWGRLSGASPTDSQTLSHQTERSPGGASSCIALRRARWDPRFALHRIRDRPTVFRILPLDSGESGGACALAGPKPRVHRWQQTYRAVHDDPVAGAERLSFATQPTEAYNVDVEAMIIAVVEHRLDFVGLVDWFRRRIVWLPGR